MDATGIVRVSERGAAQGTVISPLLANIYLHYALDLWAECYRRREATGDMIIVRVVLIRDVGWIHRLFCDACPHPVPNYVSLAILSFGLGNPAMDDLPMPIR